MSCRLHITRGNDWGEDHPNKITREEWQRIVEADPDLKLYDAWEGHPDPVYRLEIPDLDNAFYYAVVSPKSRTLPGPP